MLMLRSLFLFFLIALVTLFAGAIGGAVTGLTLALIAVSCVLFYHLVNLSRLNAWLRAPTLDEAPRGILAWNDAFDRIYAMVRSQKKRKEQLSSSLERFHRAGEAMPDGMVILDEHDRIEWCNPAAARHLGLDRETDQMQQITHLVRVPALREYLNEQEFSHPLVLRMSRPQEQVFTIQLVPFDSNRKLLLSRDITQLDKVLRLRQLARLSEQFERFATPSARREYQQLDRCERTPL